MSTHQELEQALLQAHIDNAEREVEKLLLGLSLLLTYHQSTHTFEFVYPESMALATAEGLKSEDLLVVAVIALFHDTGFLTQYVANEPVGAQHAKDYALSSTSDTLQEAAQIIFNAIINTNMQLPPKNIFERIVRDADLSVIGKPEFMEWSMRLREEVQQHPESSMYPFTASDRQWARFQLTFLEQHQWFTESARTMYQVQKEANIRQFKQYFADALS